MRIEPVGPRYSYWTIHWPWWRFKLRATYCNLPGAIQRALDIAARQLMRKRFLQLPHEKITQPWQPPSEPDTRPLGLHWPSDEPPPPPTKINIRLVEEPRPHEEGDFFDFLI